MNYEFSNIEAKWQKIWEEKNLYAASNGGDKEKFFGRVPFPCIAYNQREYRCDKWWRGPLWLSLAWLLVETLEK